MRFFDHPKSYFFTSNPCRATNSGPIFKIFVICTPQDLSGSNECIGWLLGSSVLEELPDKSTWYFFFGTKEVYIYILGGMHARTHARTNTHTHTNTHMHTHTPAHTHRHTQTHTDTHRHTHAHTHTHTVCVFAMGSKVA